MVSDILNFMLLVPSGCCCRPYDEEKSFDERQMYEDGPREAELFQEQPVGEPEMETKLRDKSMIACAHFFQSMTFT